MRRLFSAFLFGSVSTFILSSCSSTPLTITQHQSVGQNERVQSLVMHFTAGNYKRSLFALKESGAVSSHYLIPDPNDDSYPADKLAVIQLVTEDKRAWHAGHSYWQGRHNLNDTSIGIEIVNRPDCRQEPPMQNVHFRGGEYGLHMACDFPQYSEAQMQLLIQLSQDILKRNPDITPTRVVGHSDIAPERKSDPGPSFPWYQLYEQGVGAWYDEATLDWYLALFQQYQPSLRLVQKALHFYGYEIAQTGLWDEQTANVLYAFQSHFLPHQVTGEPTIETAAVLFSLLDKYHQGLLEALLRKYFTQAELVYSKRVKDDSEPNYQWLDFNTGEGEYELQLKNLKQVAAQQLTIFIDSYKYQQLRVPENINSLSLPIEVAEGKHWLEVKSEANLEHLSMSIIVQ